MIAQEPQQRGQEHRAGGNALEEQVQHQIEAPRLLVRHVVVHARVAGLIRVRVQRAERAQPHLPFAEHERPHRNLRPDRRFVGAQIEDLRPGAFFRLAHHERFALGNLRDFARRIVQVAENAALGRAHAHARRLELVLEAVRAEVALLGGLRVRVDEQLIVRARGHARAAADAPFAVQIDDAVAPAEERAGRADVHARRILALVAQHRQEQPLRLREHALLDRLHPAPIHPDGNVMLGLARNRAGMTPDALPEIDREAVSGHEGGTITNWGTTGTTCPPKPGGRRRERRERERERRGTRAAVVGGPPSPRLRRARRVLRDLIHLPYDCVQFLPRRCIRRRLRQPFA